MNNRWRRRYRLGEYTKLGPTIKRVLILGRRFQNHCCNPPTPSFRKGAKHYAAKCRRFD